MIHSCISIVALLGMGTAAATNTTIIEAANDYNTTTTNEKTITAGILISRVDYNGDTDINSTMFFDGRSHDETSQNRDVITPTLWPTYAPTPFTKSPTTPIPSYSPTAVPTKTPSPPTPSPSTTPSTFATTLSPEVSFITGSGTQLPGETEPTVSPIIPSPTPNPVSDGTDMATAIPTSTWRKKKRNLRHREDQDED